MEDGSMWQAIILIICLLLSALYSMSETSLTSFSKIRLRNMKEEGVKGAERIEKLLQDPGKLLSGILVGNNLANITASSVSAVMAQNYFENNAVAISTAVMTFLILVFGEITPKTIAAKNAEKVALKLAGFVSVSLIIFTPAVLLLQLITGRITGSRATDNAAETPLITEAEFKTLVEVGHEEGVLEPDEKFMINNVFDFSSTSAEDIMVNRTDIAAVDIDDSYDEIYDMFKVEGFTRLPVYKDSIDSIVGILNFRDFILSSTDEDDFDIKKLLREPLFTYESKSTAELFSVMRSGRHSVAVVLDEYGGTSGIVTLEDIIEEIVGEIDDEYDEPKEEIIVVTDGEYLIEGTARLEDVSQEVGIDLQSEDFDTMGGFVIGILGRFPAQGETVIDNGNLFVIEEVDKNRVVRVRMQICDSDTASGDEL